VDEFGPLQPSPTEGALPMHDLLIGLAFVGMVISPAIVAAFSNTSEEVNAE
jgi:hypothetical protein